MKKNKYILDDIASEIGSLCVRYGRIPVTQTKDKFGTVRVYCGFGISSLHALIWPNYCYKHKYFPKWLWNLDISYSDSFFGLISKVIFPYQKFIYRLAYMKAVWKHPDLFDAITCCADYPEYLGFSIPTLCTNHSSEKVGGRNYLSDEASCDECNPEKDDG